MGLLEDNEPGAIPLNEDPTGQNTVLAPQVTSQDMPPQVAPEDIQLSNSGRSNYLVGEGIDDPAKQLAAALASKAEATTPENRLRAQQASDFAEAMALKGTGINPQFKDISGVPQNTSGLPSTLRDPNFEAIQAQELEKEQRKIAAQNAQQALQQKQAKDQVDANAEADKKITETDLKVKEDFKGSNFWESLGNAAAIMLGAYSQGLTGSKENPGLKAVEARIDKEVERRKYNAEQEASLRKLAVEDFNMRLAHAKYMTDNAQAQANITKLQAETGKLYQDAAGGQRAMTMLQKPFLNRAELMNLQVLDKQGAEMAANYIPDPYAPDKYYRTVDKVSAEALRKFGAETGSVIPQIDSLLDFAENNHNKMSIPDRQILNTKLSGLVGQLRIALTGPGAMTEKEREVVLQSLGNANKILGIKSWELNKIREVRNMVQLGMKASYKHLGGIDIGDAPVSAKEQDIQKLMSRGVTRDQALKIIQNRQK